MFRRLALATVALLGAVSAQLTVTSPSSNDWWVAQSLNTLSWTCNSSPYQTFTVLLTNSNPSVLNAPLAIIAIENNFDCSKTITQQQSAQPAGTGYAIQLANPLNNTDVYATSETFEIKALGSAYPTTTSGVGSSATSSSASATTTATKTGGVLARTVPVGMGMAAALALGLVVA